MRPGAAIRLRVRPHDIVVERILDPDGDAAGLVDLTGDRAEPDAHIDIGERSERSTVDDAEGEPIVGRIGARLGDTARAVRFAVDDDPFRRAAAPGQPVRASVGRGARGIPDRYQLDRLARKGHAKRERHEGCTEDDRKQSLHVRLPMFARIVEIDSEGATSAR